MFLAPSVAVSKIDNLIAVLYNYISRYQQIYIFSSIIELIWGLMTGPESLLLPVSPTCPYTLLEGEIDHVYQLHSQCPSFVLPGLAVCPSRLCVPSFVPPVQRCALGGGGAFFKIFFTRVQPQKKITQLDLRFCENEESKRFKINEKGGQLDRKLREN